MRRTFVLGMLVAVGALSIAVSGQAPPGASQKAIDATKIEKVKDNLYIITGSGAEETSAFSGGNVAVFITDGGGHRFDRGFGQPGCAHFVALDSGHRHQRRVRRYPQRIAARFHRDRTLAHDQCLRQKGHAGPSVEVSQIRGPFPGPQHQARQPVALRRADGRAGRRHGQPADRPRDEAACGAPHGAHQDKVLPGGGRE